MKQQILAEIGCAKSAISYHAKSVKSPPNYKVHDWAEVQRFYDAGHSGRQCMRHFPRSPRMAFAQSGGA